MTLPPPNILPHRTPPTICTPCASVFATSIYSSAQCDRTLLPQYLLHIYMFLGGTYTLFASRCLLHTSTYIIYSSAQNVFIFTSQHSSGRGVMNDLLREESIFFYIESSGSVRTEIIKVRTISYKEILVFVFKDLKIRFLISRICIFRTGFRNLCPFVDIQK